MLYAFLAGAQPIGR